MSSLAVTLNQVPSPLSATMLDEPSGSSRTVDLAACLRKAIEARPARVGVIGLGYVGLPVVELFAGNGVPWAKICDPGATRG